MDKETRNLLAKVTQDCRFLLEDEFSEQLGGTFDIFSDGRIAESPGAPLTPAQHLVREKIVAAIHHRRSKGEPDAESVSAFVRECAFTYLNRIAALKMMEAREIAQECVSKGDESAGFKEFCGLAPGLVALPDRGYQLYLECLFDEVSREVGVLFDRSDPNSLLWPRRQALDAVLDALNHKGMADTWGQDETIGWLYQYFNSTEERKKMREESAAPRNSRELAVRNQFFTPRYVVEFLTDNTLGRIWYEMCGGATSLKERCRYLVRRPTEIFLEEDQEAPEPPKEEGLSQEELLKQPVHIPHRPLKDPREIRLLDPACGSMHFGLYAFDLFEVIYEEAWDNQPELLKDLREELGGDKAAFLKQVPRLIIEHNLHGVDIDPRCTQIAALSLWLRAQKSWQNQKLKAVDRPVVRRSNIVCAEPMPGSDAMLEDFVQTLDPPLLGELVKTVFDKMQLAGEAGTLLKIEEEIRTAIDDARQAWEKLQRQSPELFSTDELNRITDQPEPSNLDTALRAPGSQLTGDFFDTAEERIYAALRDYAESAEAGDYQRRLFAEDAAHGFAFIDLCRKRYDAVVMNPPFGEASGSSYEYIDARYHDWNKNILCAFIERTVALSGVLGSVGAIYDRTAVIKSTYEDFRRRHLVPDDRLRAMADLGWEVLDANVEVTTSILSGVKGQGVFVDLRGVKPDQKAENLEDSLRSLNGGSDLAGISIENASSFRRFPNTVIGYDFPRFLRVAFSHFQSLDEHGLTAYQGHALKSDKHFRVWWECDPASSNLRARLFNGAGYSPYKTRQLATVVAPVAIDQIPKDSATVLRNRTKHLKCGVCFGKRGEFFTAHVLPEGFIFTVEGQSFPVPDEERALTLLGFLNTPLVRYSLNRFCGQHKYSGYVNLLPYVDLPTNDEVATYVRNTVGKHTSAESLDELSPVFVNVLPNATTLNETTKSLKIRVQSALEASRETERYCSRSVEEAFGLTVEESRSLSEFSDSQPAHDFPLEDVSQFADLDWFVGHSLISNGVGTAFGRWDIRYATGERQPPELPDPFDPLPVCPPGMLQNADGLPAAAADVPDDYPLRITWPGILVDDPDHSEDIVGRVREAMEVIWKERAENIEEEACEILGVKSLRDYFRKPAKFFADHHKRYSKSRRQAPVYWPLSTESGAYTFWIYYHRLTTDTLFMALREFVQPRLQTEEIFHGRVQQETSTNPSPENRQKFAESEKLLGALRSLETELKRVAPLFKPDLNDGVIINLAPLWRMIPHSKWQKDCKACWDKLVKGDYDWAHLAMHLWPERVVPKCQEDRSLAIAHGLDEVFWLEDAKGKVNPTKTKQSVIDELIAERSSPAVKAALEDLLSAPAPAGTTKKRARRKKTA